MQKVNNMEQNDWYRNGLRFGCKQCGRCCTGEEGYVWVTEEEISQLAESLGLARIAFENSFVRSVHGKKSLIEFSNGDCVLFNAESKGCRAYQKRPAQCRTWPWWPQNLDRPNSWKKAAKFCHGCNNPNGKLFTEEEIKQEMNKTF